MTVEASAIGMLEAAPSLRERVHQAIEQSIVDGTLAPGAHLREDDLAKRLGVSRNPVREALQALVQHGYADHFQGRGVYVHSPTLTEVEDVFDTRAVLEGECARLAAERLKPEQLAELETILRTGSSAVGHAEPNRLLVLNEQFHAAIAAASGNSVMSGMIDSLQRRIRWYFAGVVVARAPDSWEQHAHIVQALADGDGPLAASLMRSHVSASRESIKQHLSHLPEAESR